MNKQEVLQWVMDTFGTEPQYPWDDCNAILRHSHNRKWYGVLLVVPRSKFGLPGDDPVDVLNVKCDVLLSAAIRGEPGIYPAYHMNKDKWISILLDNSVDQGRIIPLIEMSYDLTAGRKSKK